MSNSNQELEYGKCYAYRSVRFKLFFQIKNEQNDVLQSFDLMFTNICYVFTVSWESVEKVNK